MWVVVKKVSKRLMFILIMLSPIIAVFCSLFIGRYPLTISDVFNAVNEYILSGFSEQTTIEAAIVLDIRLPRALLGVLVGGSLAVSGAALQSLFRNPLVDTGILGVSSGAGFGAALAIILFNSYVLIYVFAFTFGLIAVLLSYLVGRVSNTSPAIMLVLGGVVISSIFSAFISLLKYVADPYNELPAITFWLMGSLANAEMKDIAIASIPIFIGVAGLFTLRWRLNILSLGDKKAQALGVSNMVYKLLIVLFTTLATAGSVAVTGIIGWVGLIIPHIGRMLVGNNNAYLIPVSLSLGATFLLIIDNIGRVLTGSEIPLSILTAIIGGPFYIYFLKRTKAGGW